MLKDFTIKDEKQLVTSLKNIVKAVKTQENPEELNQYRKIFKKAVPLTMRSYVAAYLIKEAKTPDFLTRGLKKDGKTKPWQSSFRSAPFSRPIRPKVTLSDEESASLFIGIGRKRGVFPKDIITLLIQGAGIARGHIGDIRILDNYCFVQVMAEDASLIIEKLNNSYYRGKSLTVSHSRRQEEDLFAASGEQMPGQNTQDMMEEEIKSSGENISEINSSVETF